jgi:hypothetical protein
MEGTEHGPNTPEPAKRFGVGDLVHVYQGTAPGTPGKKTEAFIGRVVGYDAQHQKWLVCDLCYTLYVCCLLLPSLAFSCLVDGCFASRSYCGRAIRCGILFCPNVDIPTWWQKNSCRGYLITLNLSIHNPNPNPKPLP